MFYIGLEVTVLSKKG